MRSPSWGRWRQQWGSLTSGTWRQKWSGTARWFRRRRRQRWRKTRSWRQRCRKTENEDESNWRKSWGINASVWMLSQAVLIRVKKTVSELIRVKYWVEWRLCQAEMMASKRRRSQCPVNVCTRKCLCPVNICILYSNKSSLTSHSAKAGSRRWMSLLSHHGTN